MTPTILIVEDEKIIAKGIEKRLPAAATGHRMFLVDMYHVAGYLGKTASIVEGEGTSSIGEVTHHWKANDVISLPHWQWVEHKARSDAIVFMVTDKPLLSMLGYLREETRV